MAVKLVDMFVPKEGWTHEEFVEYLRDDHAEFIEQLPDLQRYAISIPADLREYDTPFPDGPHETDFDAIVELYFEDLDDLFEAFESEAGQRLIEDARTFVMPREGPTYIMDEAVPSDDE